MPLLTPSMKKMMRAPHAGAGGVGGPVHGHGHARGHGHGAGAARGSVLECASPLALSRATDHSKSSRGLEQSRTQSARGCLPAVPAPPAPASAWLCLLMLSGLGVPQARAQGAMEREHALKAACVFNFCQFITWPADAFDAPSSPIVIGVYGNDAFGNVLEAMVRGEIVRGRAIQVQRCRRAEDSLDCHMLFVSGAETARSGQLLNQIRNRGIVSVGENDDFISSGGMIALAAVQNRVRLRINLPAVRAGGVSVSSKLLRLADIVQ
ncbi:MAG: YfiR family protein [Prosthecobacter sp.]